MDEHLETNRRHWDELVPLHTQSDYYDVASFKAGKSSLHDLERQELGDVRGKTLLHLQCHFGMDSLSWAREGAVVTGIDFSGPAIEAARALAAETGVEARFVVSDVYSLPENLDERFDVVYASYGVLFWLPDMARWAAVVAHFLKPGGTLYIVEFHPIQHVFDTGEEAGDLNVNDTYFPPAGPLMFDDDGSYARPDAKLTNRVTYSWPHPLSEVVTALAESGLHIEFLHEFPFTVEKFFPFMEPAGERLYRLTKRDGAIPLLYSIKATKPR
jgi:SAM-dependent methyltransferase